MVLPKQPLEEEWDYGNGFRPVVIHSQELGCLCPVSPEAGRVLVPVIQKLWDEDIMTME